MEIAAYHEAGHVFMAIYLGARVRSVTIEPDRDDGPDRFGDAQVEWDLAHFTPRELYEKSVLVALAGPVAEMIHRGAPPQDRQILDIYAPDGAKNLPVVCWIHGGGWQAGDKTDVQIKPRVFTERGYVFVSTNYRLLPNLEMDVQIRDVAKALGWMHKHIAEHGGDPQRIFVMGHSAGAQLAALICIDDRYLKAESVPLDVLKGCAPVDGDIYDLPAMIMSSTCRSPTGTSATAETSDPP
jgi:acetyl esterase/lipase